MMKNIKRTKKQQQKYKKISSSSYYHYLPSLKRFKVSKSFVLSIEKNEEIRDFLIGMKLKWRFLSTGKAKKMDQVRFFELSFDNKYREKVLSCYLPFVLKASKSIKEENRVLKMYSVMMSSWRSVDLEFSAVFQKLEVNDEVEKMIMEDLGSFVKKRKGGKAWKRGYFLYGPSGIGKSNLIASIANYLNFDVYNLELSDFTSNSDLRKLLVSSQNRSILVVEDTDSRPLLAKVEQKENQQLTLSRMLNFVDKMWSNCGDERIIVLTTSNKERLDPALLCPGHTVCRLLREHIVPGLFSFEYMKNPAFGSKRQTMTSGRCITVTSADKRDGNSTLVYVGGVEITHPHFFNNGMIVAHRLEGFISRLSPFSCDIEWINSISFPQSDENRTSTTQNRPSPAAVMRLMLRDAMLHLHNNGFSVISLALKVKYPEIMSLQKNLWLCNCVHDLNARSSSGKGKKITKSPPSEEDLECLSSGTDYKSQNTSPLGSHQMHHLRSPVSASKPPRPPKRRQSFNNARPGSPTRNNGGDHGVRSPDSETKQGGGGSSEDKESLNALEECVGMSNKLLSSGLLNNLQDRSPQEIIHQKKGIMELIDSENILKGERGVYKGSCLCSCGKKYQMILSILAE
ncbi:hypothetical protein ACHQM5_022949 [Ranunculus cassubicifolius]